MGEPAPAAAEAANESPYKGKTGVARVIPLVPLLHWTAPSFANTVG